MTTPVTRPKRKWKSKPVAVKDGVQSELLLREPEEGNMPFDLPVVGVVHELQDDHGTVKGYTLEFDCIAYGRKVFIRLGREEVASIKVLVSGEQGTRIVYEGQRGDSDDRYDSIRKGK